MQPVSVKSVSTSDGQKTGYSTCSPEAFPSKWMKGVGLSVWQNSSDEHSQWTAYIKKKKYFGQPYPEAWARSNDFWNEYAHDIKMAKGLGINSFRFSFEWARLYPTSRDGLDQSAVDRYHQMLDVMQEHELEPNATMHHFTHPQWFEDLGGFSKEENIPVFVEYAVRVYNLFSGRVRLWATFNEPTCFAFVGYIIGLWAPGDFLQFTKAGRVLLNLLRSHVAAYKAIKSLPGSQNSAVGMVHQHIKFEPLNSVSYCGYVTRWMTYWFAAEVVLKWFSTGVFTWSIPVYGEVLTFKDPDATKTLDWWGINYYSNPVMDWAFRMTKSVDSDRLTDIKFRIFPQGLYNSIRDASVLKVPIYITETGLADKESVNRDVFIKTHYDMLLKAVRDGYDVRGCYFWTLMDNIEWHEGFHIKYGLFEWDPAVRRSIGPLKLRTGAEMLINIHATWPEDLRELVEYAEDRGNTADVTPNAIRIVSSQAVLLTEAVAISS